MKYNEAKIEVSKFKNWERFKIGNAGFFEEQQKEAVAAEQSVSRQMMMEELSKKVQALKEDTFAALYSRIDRLFYEHLLTPFEAMRENMEHCVDKRVELAVAEALQKHEKKEEELIKDINQRAETAFANIEKVSGEVKTVNTITKDYQVRFNDLWQELRTVKEQHRKLKEEMKQNHHRLYTRMDVAQKHAEGQLEGRAAFIEQQIGHIRVQALEERRDISKLLEEVFILPAKHKGELGSLARRSMAEDVIQHQQKNYTNNHRLPPPFPSKTVASPGPSKFRAIESRLDNLDTRIADLRHSQSSLTSKCSGMEEDLNFILEALEDVKDEEYVYISDDDEEEEGEQPVQENSETETESQSN
ncbi:hypothetical protein TRICI_004427 [Trichomonascus ciferrii]|uniref:Uncharacterized protein n=1 Tax=Trichomonascus ciferrii TaxID=44093 RepID=A0A642V5U5_9ASCO|nr:hypothetical protein TRICI_004427 [Trichomonascus ciferrii]